MRHLNFNIQRKITWSIYQQMKSSVALRVSVIYCATKMLVKGTKLLVKTQEQQFFPPILLPKTRMAQPQNGTQVPPPAWRNSEAKKLLGQLMMDELSWIHLCLVGQIYHTEARFKQYKWENFRNNFNTMATKFELDKERIAFEHMAFNRYQTKHPRTATTNRGVLFWDGHAAQKLLIQDVKKQVAALLFQCRLLLRVENGTVNFETSHTVVCPDD